MTSLPAVPRSLEPWGVQEPRISWAPQFAGSLLDEALELISYAGLELFPWQETVLAAALAMRLDGRWAALDLGLMVSRQNGKGELILARELVGLFLLGERLIVHSAHLADTAMDGFRRFEEAISGVDLFEKRIGRNGIRRGNGKESITLKNGQTIRFRTRTKGGGRGLSGDCVFLDEAMYLPEAVIDALRPVISARENPQIWFTGSAVDQEADDSGVAFARVRQKGINHDPDLAYFEWSVDSSLGELTGDVAADPLAWAQANPSLGYRISHRAIASEQRGGLSARGFAVERLGIGDWPDPDGQASRVISLAEWQSCCDESSGPVGDVSFALDVSPDRHWGSFAVAGRSAHGGTHIELVERESGTGWLVARAVELQQKWGGVLAVAAGSPAASLLPELEAEGVNVVVVSTAEHAQACGKFYDAAVQGELKHLGQPELNAAIHGAERKFYGDAWLWSRRGSGAADISPLVAVTLAKWVFDTREPVMALPEAFML